MYRELFEEAGLSRYAIRFYRNWLRYGYQNVWCVGTQSRYVSARNKSGFSRANERRRNQYANQQYAGV